MSELLQDILTIKSNINHICIICTQFPPYPEGISVMSGGVQEELKDFVDEIKKHGFNLTIITQHYIKKCNKDPNYIHRVRTYIPCSLNKNKLANILNYLVNESFNPLTFIRIYKILRRKKPDVVLLNGSYQLSVAPLIASAILRIPILSRYDWLCPTYPKDYACNVKERICDCGNCLEKYNNLNLSRIVRSFFGLFSASIYLLKVKLWNHCYTRIYPVNNFYAKLFIDWGVLENKIKVIRPSISFSKNFVVNGEFKELKDQSKIIFAYIGRLNEEKGIRILLKSFKIALNYYKDMILIIAGDGPLRELVEESASENSQIKYLGWLDRYEIGKIYTISDIIVIPSIVPEGHPLVVEEAMSLNKTIIGSNMGGLREVLRTYERGILVDEMSGEAFAEKILGLVEEIELK